ncbi:MAG: hypothetical protein U0166_11895 [Acidobacteriota bacterium]
MPRWLVALSVALLIVGSMTGMAQLCAEIGCGEDACPSCDTCGCCLHAYPLPSVPARTSVTFCVAPRADEPAAMTGEPREVLHVPRAPRTISTL